MLMDIWLAAKKGQGTLALFQQTMKTYVNKTLIFLWISKTKQMKLNIRFTPLKDHLTYKSFKFLVGFCCSYILEN